MDASRPKNDLTHSLADAVQAAECVLAGFSGFESRFAEITTRAKDRFAKRDWRGMHEDAIERLDLYSQVIACVVDQVSSLLGDRTCDSGVWSLAKREYAARIVGRPDLELRETWFNSVIRRILHTVGVDPEVEFLEPPVEAAASGNEEVTRVWLRDQPLPRLVRSMLDSCGFGAVFEDAERDAELTARAIHQAWRARGSNEPILAIEMARSPFFRNKGAYLVGRVCGATQFMPIALALHHEERGIFVDAVLNTADELSIVFSFTRSYFHVDVINPYSLVAFLKSILPHKALSELYTAIGFNKHGKTLLYRDLMEHIRRSIEPFEIAPGARGMVMIVFTLPSFDIVFKVIRDSFEPPKTTTRADVLNKYKLVFQHDRAGRLADAQEFEHLAFPRDRFTPELLEELLGNAANTVELRGESVHIRHLYTERRMTPLNLYLAQADLPAAQEAIVDYGQAVKDLAATNIFPGDMLLKNFGVTRHQRVVFYDYDELCHVTDCEFQELPPDYDLYDQFGSESWFNFGPNVIFPEEFLTFMGLPPALRMTFVQHHHDLLTPAYWQQVQQRHRAGEVMDIFPYSCRRRLRNADFLPYRPSRRIRSE
jgi:isocitrate dehydrogenase kinase/phosphatase